MSAWIVIEKVKQCNVANQVDLRHMCEVEGSNVVDLGIDLSEFYMSVEWDILEVPAVRWAQFSIKILFWNHFDLCRHICRNEKFYTCCDEPYLDITFNITMRRKTLFYTVRLCHDFLEGCKPIIHCDFFVTVHLVAVHYSYATIFTSPWHSILVSIQFNSKPIECQLILL